MRFIVVLFGIFAFFIATTLAADKSACALPKVVGPCRKADNVYYYNAEEKQCQSFIYGGCQGNENRFDSKDACEKLCVA